MPRHGIIYKITNRINGKCYIGQTVGTLKNRWRCHVSDKHSCCTYLKRAIQKYGKESFKVEELSAASNQEDLNDLEEQFIKDLNCLAPNGYNLRTGGKVSKMSEVTKRRFSEVRMGIPRVGRAAKGFAKYVKQPNSRKVTCQCLKTGIEVSYPTMGMAEMDGFCSVAIYDNCTGKYSQHKGFRWRFSEDEVYPVAKLSRPSHFEQKQFDGKVIAISKDTGEVAYIFNSRFDIDRTQFDIGHVRKCLSGKSRYKTHKGLIWRFE